MKNVIFITLMEQARGESCPFGGRRGAAAPGEYSFSSPGHDFSFRIYNSNNPRMKTEFPRVDAAPESVETPTIQADLRFVGAHGAGAH